MNCEEKQKINEMLTYCLEQLEEAQKYVRDGLPNEARIFAENAKRQLQTVPVRLGMMTN